MVHMCVTVLCSDLLTSVQVDPSKPLAYWDKVGVADVCVCVCVF